MKKPTNIQLVVLAGLFVLVFVVAIVKHQNQPRVLAQRNHPDGTSTVIVGKPRLCGLLGIEIVLENRGMSGARTYGSVQDLLGSWKEAILKYENPEGGGLLTPLNEQ